MARRRSRIRVRDARTGRFISLSDIDDGMLIKAGDGYFDPMTGSMVSLPANMTFKNGEFVALPPEVASRPKRTYNRKNNVVKQMVVSTPYGLLPARGTRTTQEKKDAIYQRLVANAAASRKELNEVKAACPFIYVGGNNVVKNESVITSCSPNRGANRCTARIIEYKSGDEKVIKIEKYVEPKSKKGEKIIWT